jgi:hypothetical protein
MLSFGQPYKGSDKIDVGISDDKRALTITFSDMQLNLEGGGKSAQPIGTRVFTVMIPVGGDEEQVQIAFGLNGFALATEGTTATLVMSVNGKTVVRDIAAKSEESIVQELEFKGPRPAECRLCVFLLVGLEANNKSAAASLSVTAIDAEFLPRPK